MSYAEPQAQVLPSVNDQAPLLSFVSKMLNKLIRERDWSAQAVSHILLQLTFQKSSRMLASLDCRPIDAQRDLIVFLESGETTATVADSVVHHSRCSSNWFLRCDISIANRVAFYSALNVSFCSRNYQDQHLVMKTQHAQAICSNGICQD